MTAVTGHETSWTRRDKIMAALCLIFPLGFVLTVILGLSWPGQSFHQRPLFTEGTATEVVPLVALPQADGAVQETLTFTVAGATAPRTVEQIDLLFGTYRTRPRLISAKLESESGRCKLAVRHGQLLEDNRLLRFEPKNSCVLELGDTLILTLYVKDSSSLALFGLTSMPEKTFELATQAPSGAKVTPFGYIVAQFDAETKSVSRFRLLEGMWREVRAGEFWLESRFGYVALALILSLSLLLFSRLTKILSEQRLFSAAGYGFLFMCFGLLYATITPPFEAPDEATHYNTYQKSQPLLADALDLAHHGQYKRIMCRTDQIYTVADLTDKVDQGGWPQHVSTTNMETRSILGTALWDFYRAIDSEENAGVQLWKLRRNNVLLLAGLLFLSIFACYPLLSSREVTLQGFALAAIFFPATLPNFGMHLSNHPITLAGYIMLMVALPSLLGLGISKLRLGTVGVALTLLLLSGRTGLVASVFLASLLLLTTWSFYWISALPIQKEKLHKTFLNLVWLMTPLGLALLTFGSHSYFASNQGYSIQFLEELIKQKPLLIATVVCSSILFALLPIFLSQLAKRSSNGLEKGIQCIGVLGSLGCLILLLLPLIYQAPQVPEIEFATWDHIPFTFVKTTLKSLVGNLGLGGQDFFLFWSFWGGFGCPDRTLPSSTIQIFKVLTLAGWFCYCLTLVLRRDAKDFFVGSTVAVVGILWLTAISYATGRISINMHGRFTLGFHLLTISFASWGFFKLWETLLVDRQNNQFQKWESLALVLIVACFSHAAGSWWQLYRFFGS